KICWGPELIGSSGSFDRVWWVYMHPDTGDIWIARSDESFVYWEHRERLLFVPSGSTNPSLAFDSAGRYVVAVEFLPAGATQKEIWIYEYPYTGTGVRQIGYGERPLLFTDHNGITHLFYQHTSKEYICHRTSTDNFVAEICLLDTAGYYPLGIRQVDYPIAPPWYVQTRYIFFFGDGEGLPRYFLSKLVDRYVPEVVEVSDQISLLAEVPDVTWQGLEEITVEVFDEISLSAGIGIEWSGVEKITVEVFDEISLTASVGTSWVEIVTETVEISDEVELSTNLESILWLEVDEE
ncbi:MAG: hypothetical protein QM401_05025, partial [Bacillota bacterium]|nr:hypothetical protein [Bacillota bacterium]